MVALGFADDLRWIILSVRTIVQPTSMKSTKSKQARPSDAKFVATTKPEPKLADAQDVNAFVREWRAGHSYLLLALLTLVCLVPFCGAAFHIDDTLFVWAAQHIAKHPLDPYGFPVVWYQTSMPMSAVTKNPPLTSYYIAAIGRVVGWSEKALHLAFLLPALIVILGTYYLARRFTHSPLLAAVATLLTPAFLVSSTRVMCDTMMVAAWIVAIIFWLEGLDRQKPALLGVSGLLIAICALTKYFGIALIPLLLVYSIVRRKRLGSWILFLLIPTFILAGYQHWTHILYGQGLLSQAAAYDPIHDKTWISRIAIGACFAGGCALPALTFTPILWRPRAIILGALIAGIVGLGCAMGWIHIPTLESAKDLQLVCLQLSFLVFGGMSLFALAVSDWLKRKDADSLLLLLWILGTFAFATFFNWTVNARSVLPLIPAAGILLARRLDSNGAHFRRERLVKVLTPLALAAIISIWVTSADVKLANSARLAAQYVRDHANMDPANVGFEGHWGFQYYMERFGFQPLELTKIKVGTGNLIVLPENNDNIKLIPPQFVESQWLLSLDANIGVATMNTPLGAGFYADVFGPLPYAFGLVPAERYMFVRLKTFPVPVSSGP